MDKPKLNHWKNIDDIMAFDDKYPSVTLEYESPLYCDITPDGKIQIKTISGGGHGEARYLHQGLSPREWICLIKEAEQIMRYYWF